MRIKEGVNLLSLKKFGFVEGGYYHPHEISVNKHGIIDIGRHMHWYDTNSYYCNDRDVIIDMINAGIVEKGE